MIVQGWMTGKSQCYVPSASSYNKSVASFGNFPQESADYLSPRLRARLMTNGAPFETFDCAAQTIASVQTRPCPTMGLTRIEVHP
ncbi:hypothetical protein BCAR13_1840035 [Paraburkholderia caribensis]|nr:hypothetical protein BCAR13_1840035 [Paraburkholderia caribensis]